MEIRPMIAPYPFTERKLGQPNDCAWKKKFFSEYRDVTKYREILKDKDRICKHIWIPALSPVAQR